MNALRQRGIAGNGTPEAKQQRGRTPKTHFPHRSPVSARKDKNAG